jgi:hypothetical protein
VLLLELWAGVDDVVSRWASITVTPTAGAGYQDLAGFLIQFDGVLVNTWQLYARISPVDPNAATVGAQFRALCDRGTVGPFLAVIPCTTGTTPNDPGYSVTFGP